MAENIITALNVSKVEFVTIQFWHWCSVAKHFPDIKCLCNIKFLLESNESNLKDGNEMREKKTLYNHVVGRREVRKIWSRSPRSSDQLPSPAISVMSALDQNWQLLLLLAIACTI